MPIRHAALRPKSSGSLVLVLMAIAIGSAAAAPFSGAGEPAETFLTRLRAANYFDTAILYLDRIGNYPGVDPEFKTAIGLEKAQTYIDAARVSRNSAARNTFLEDASTELDAFLKLGSHPRQSEARLKLGTLQMFRAAQLMVPSSKGDAPDDAKRKEAREGYESAAATFDKIVENLREKLKEMQGANIDAKKNPQQATQRDQYRGDFLQALSMAGEARLQAAKTFTDPGKDGKQGLEDALKMFVDLSEKYDDFPPGAIALMSRGVAQELLAQKEPALDSYIRMLETPDIDALRDAKFQAASGIIRLSLAETPPKYQLAIDRGKSLIDGLRPNERRAPTAMQLQVDLAKAYLVKAKDSKDQKPADLKRSESEGRQLLIKASKVEGDHVAEATKMLADLGIESSTEEVAELPTAEDPDSVDDAYAKAIELYQASENIAQTISAANGKEGVAELEKQLAETRSIASRVLSRGLTMINTKTDIELANNARQLLAFLLYQDQRFRDATVVGSFLAKTAPGSEMGMKGGLIARNSLQNLLIQNTSNTRLVSQLKDLADYTIRVWPDHPETPIFQRLIVELALQDDRFDDARTLINAMADSPTRALLHRKLGLFLYQQSVQTRIAGDDGASEKFQKEAKAELQTGLDAISGALSDDEAMKAALVLVKLHLRADEVDQATKTLNNDKYGPTKVAERLGTSDEAFTSDLYSTQLNLLVQQMTQPGSNTDELIGQASEVMDKLRDSIKGEDASTRLSAIYLRMARDIREQLDTANANQKTKLIQAFRVFLERIAATTEDPATLQWIGQTVMQLAEASMEPTETKASGQAAELLGTAVETFGRLKAKSKDVSLSVDFQLGRAQRLMGDYKGALDTLDPILRQKPNMLNAQMEASLAYEQWAGILPPKYAGNAYESALNGARPDAAKKKVIWGWGKISQLTSSNESFRDMFFESRYHVALCRFLWGKATKETPLIEKSVGDITKVAALYPELGGPEQRKKFDQLLRLIQKELGQKVEGLPPLAVPPT